MEGRRKLKLKSSRRPTTDSQMGRSGSSSAGGSRRARNREELGEIAKHYPWLQEFDNEVKTNLTGPEVTNDNVINLLTSLESYVSPEVTKLKNKPNRATKFLAQIRKRISLVKMGGYLMVRECELQLFPTYGLLMTHFVNITLTSSKVEKVGAEQVAQELYYLLKLIFQEDPEYVLDVALCSTLDEQAASKHKVGYHLFSYIVEDWRYFSECDSMLMKYCAVASLLSEASHDRRVFVERRAPSEMGSSFPKFLKRNNVDIGGGSLIKKKPSSLRNIIQTIKVTQVKSISRGRLVIVSRKNVSRSIRELSDEDDSDAESTNSTLVNMPQRLELPSSSGLNSQAQGQDDPMSSFFNEIGLGFSLDTIGDVNLHQESNSSVAGTGYSYDREFDTDYLDDHNQEDCHVSSSTVPQARTSTPSSQLLNDEIKSEPEEEHEHSTLEIDADNEDEDDDDESDRKNLSIRSRRSSKLAGRKRKSSEIGTHSAAPFEDDDDNDTEETVHLGAVDVDTLENVDNRHEKSEDNHSQDGEEDKDITGYEPCSDNEEQREPPSDFEDDYYESRRQSPPKSADVSGATEKAEKDLNAEDDDSSDLEILSEKSLSKNSDSDDEDSDRSRDEAEPESGEDFVPNYDVDSDEEAETGNGVDVEDKGLETEDEENKNKDEVANSRKEISQDTSKNGENLQPTPDVKAKPGQDEVVPPATENEADQQGDEPMGNDDEEEETSPPGTLILTPRKSSRVSGKDKVQAQRSSALLSGRKATPKSTSTPKPTKSQRSPPKKLKMESDEDDDDYDADNDKESEDTVSQDSLEPLPSSSQRGRGRKSAAGADKAINAKPESDISTRRSTRSTRVISRFTPPKVIKKTRAKSPVASTSTATTPKKTRTVTRSAKAPVEEETEKTSPMTTRAARGRGRPTKK